MRFRRHFIEIEFPCMIIFADRMLAFGYKLIVMLPDQFNVQSVRPLISLNLWFYNGNLAKRFNKMIISSIRLLGHQSVRLI